MNNKQNPDWYKQLKKGPMENRKDEEEFIFKIKQSIYENNEADLVKHKRPFRKRALPIVVVLVCTMLFVIVQQPWLDDNKSPVQSSTQIKPKTKDESAQDPTLKQFMNELYQSTNSKNENDLYRALNDEVLFKGKSYKKDELKFDEDIFHELQVALTMGGEFANDTKKVYKVPSGLTESNEPKQAHYIYATVTGNKTEILAEPKRESQVLYEVSNEMVKAWIPEKVQNNGYIKVSTISGNTGYVQKEYVLTDIKYSFMFEKDHEGKWKIMNIDSIW
ncbi:SH3 domain-containing protein [Bacillus sp. N5-665]|uniref:anti-sigma factor n=1 Tax=Bacillus TaxID=1386 RepID=UPI000BF921FA|nr:MULTISPECIES: anti-sigma factor [Bacillus]PFZ50124.1 anti-sigma factor [Bacillus wiedmannii]PGD59850.1 anti-sigma factor [Bacillus wiedmannii]PHA19388.1 anti-sigma factor [Bacillus wiedmannii]PHB10614.1 anti-sigma factor [Bacillus wiedmannii]UNK31438.1 SH3 domain-containing protein [Bacillus sp. N5-665]